jgi:4-methylaminobutanoate oxidase (formaldehyde-forming)
MNTTNIQAAHYIPFEGYVEHTAPVAYGFAHGAHRLGVKVHSHTPVRQLARNGGGYMLVTDTGEIEAGNLVIAAGASSPSFAAQLGVQIPVYPILHQCSVVSTCERIPADMPAIRLPDLHEYVRHSQGGLLVGGTEDALTSPEPGAQSSDLELKRLTASHKVLTGFLDRAADFFPAIRDSFTIREQRGLITVSPDLNFVVGQAPGVPGLYFASGCNGRGVQSAPGVGRLVAELISSGASWIDPAPLRLDRFGSQFQGPDALRQACIQALGSGVATETNEVRKL